MTATDIRLPGPCNEPPEELMQFDLGRADAGAAIALPPLMGCGVERWLAAGPVSTSQQGRFTVARAAHYQFASVALPVTDAEMRSVSESVYRELMALVQDSAYPQLVRFWNYVPEINRGAEDTEVYRQFCWGRADAFADLPDTELPAATAIGSADGILRVSLLSAASAITVEHMENPRQVSAYHYPRQYGPKSPSFARATQISLGDETLLLLSGTSSIVAHETRHAHNLCKQTAETQRNISELLQTSAKAAALRPVLLRYYLRDPDALAEAQTAYQGSFSGWPAAAYLQGDICRQALQMEIDGVFSTLG
ncbi:MAG: hypothetical protein AB8B93_10445 [Pseudomonadales bacterium]